MEKKFIATLQLISFIKQKAYVHIYYIELINIRHFTYILTLIAYVLIYILLTRTTQQVLSRGWLVTHHTHGGA